MHKGNEKMLTDQFTFGMPRFDFHHDVVDPVPPVVDPDKKVVDAPPVTVEELERRNIVLQNTLNKQNTEVTRLKGEKQTDATKLKEYKDQQAQIQADAEAALLKKGEYEPLIETKDKEILDLKALIAQNETDSKTQSELMERNKLESSVYQGLKGKIRDDLVVESGVKSEDKSIKAAMKLFPFKDIVIDETTKEPTNMEEVTKKYLEQFAGFVAPATEAVDGKGSIIGPGSGTTIPTDGYSQEVLLIAEKTMTPAKTIARRLNGPEKDRWEKEYSYIKRGTEENRIFKH